MSRMPSNLITEYDLMYVIGGQLFKQAPNSQPRNVEIIMTKFRDKFREKANNHNQFYSLYIEVDHIKDFIEDILLSIPEFRELNLSQIEYENKVSVDDESRAKYRFYTAYDKNDSDSWKNEILDLDAFMQNIMCSLNRTEEDKNDCIKK